MNLNAEDFNIGTVKYILGSPATGIHSELKTNILNTYKIGPFIWTCCCEPEDRKEK